MIRIYQQYITEDLRLLLLIQIAQSGCNFANPCLLCTIILRDKGAKEVHIRVSCPPIKFPCKLGIDMQTAKEFIARDKSMEEVAKLTEWIHCKIQI